MWRREILTIAVGQEVGGGLITKGKRGLHFASISLSKSPTQGVIAQRSGNHPMTRRLQKSCGQFLFSRGRDLNLAQLLFLLLLDGFNLFHVLVCDFL